MSPVVFFIHNLCLNGQRTCCGWQYLSHSRSSVYPNPSAALTQGSHQLSLKSLLAAPQVKRLSRGSDYGRRGIRGGIGSPLSAIKTIELQTARVAGLIKRALSVGKEYVGAVRDNLRRAAKRLLADQSAPLPPPPGPGPVNLHLH